ncbi:MAG: N-acetylmuramoyl-L-alanine amidase [Firmicutes bacterium]|nr:N-acetylmuramoyl-L-alanine amidase [Bacillota bacterium]
MAECRQASPNFDPVSYYNTYRDLRVAFGNDWESYYRHYMDWGKAEGRRATGVNTLTGFLSSYDGVDYHLIYDYNYYVANNPDVVRAVGRNDEAVLKHFVEWGMAEGRRGNASFNVREYREVNPDVAKALGMNWEAIYYHYLEYGYAEGRPISWDQVKKEEETISGFDGQRPYADRYIQAACYWEGRDGYSIDKIVIHHWGEDGQQQSNVVNWFVNPDSQASAHYVVSDGLVTQMVQESDTAWHAANRIANKQSIGIECHPEKTPGDVDTVVNLIANIWHSYGKVLPLTKHSDYVATDCPGRWADLNELTEKAKKIYLVMEAE